MNTSSPLRKRMALVATSIFLLLFPLLDNAEYIHLLTWMAFLVVGSACFRLVMLTGRFSLGQSFFLGIGGYTSGLLSVKAGFSPWLGLLLGGLAGAILALLLGKAILRAPGMYFAIISIALVLLTT